MPLSIIYGFQIIILEIVLYFNDKFNLRKKNFIFINKH